MPNKATVNKAINDFMFMTVILVQVIETGNYQHPFSRASEKGFLMFWSISEPQVENASEQTPDLIHALEWRFGT